MRNFLIQQLENDADADDSMAFITGDLGFSVVENLQKKLGHRFVNAGVAEQNMISVAAGLASTGFVPWVYSIAPFATMRCYEQIRNDICFHQKKSRIIGVGGAFSYGMLGPSHHALEDTHIMSALPHMMVLNPAGKNQITSLYQWIKYKDQAVYWRIGKGGGVDNLPSLASWEDCVSIIEPGIHVNLVTSGDILSEALKASIKLAGQGVNCHVLSVPVLTPFPHDSLARHLVDAPIVTVFEGYQDNPLECGVYRTVFAGGGMGHKIACVYAQKRPHRLVGSADYLRMQAGVACDSIISAVLNIIEQ